MKMKLSQSAVLFVATVLSGIGALFTLIGLTTPKWLKRGLGLWNCNHVCSSSAATLTILALLLSVISTIVLILILVHLFPRILRILPLVLMSIVTLFLLVAMASYLRHRGVVDYSFELIVTAHAFSLFAAILLAFWYGRHLEDKPANNPTIARGSAAPTPMVTLPSSRVI